MSKKIIGVVVVLLLFAAGVLYFKDIVDSSKNMSQGPESYNTKSLGQSKNVAQAPSAKNQVVYTENGFSPSTLNVNVGDSVTFVNQSSRGMWVASNPHPTHTDLPGFDAMKSIPQGSSYTYIFQKTGNWGYHNHLNRSQGGQVIVK